MKSWASPAPAVFLAEDQEVDDLFDLNEQTKSNTLSLLQNTQVTHLKEDYNAVIQDIPGRICLVHHDIPTGDSPSIRLSPYRLAHTAQVFLSEENSDFIEIRYH